MKTLVCAAMLAAAAVAVVEAAFPRPQGRVNDFAGVIDGTTADELARLIRETDTLTSAEIAVVTVKSLDGMSIEEYAVRLFADWGIGRKGKDNGVLMLVAPAERRVRIEVGYGLEPILPDALAGRIIREECLPAFRANQFSRGILQGVRRLAGIIQRRETLPASERAAPRANDSPPAYLMVPFFGVFVALGAFAAGIAVRTRTRGALLFAGLFLAVPLVFVVLTLTASSFILIAIGAVMAAVGYRAGASPFWIKTMRGSAEPMDASSPWVAGPSGSGSSGSSSSSGGDFGGGSSGGGGASGSW
jgi:uncharacterized protein